MCKMCIIGIFLVSCATIDVGKVCNEACQNLLSMQCDGYKGSPGSDDLFGTSDDISCETVCESIMKEPGFDLYPECTSKAPSCEAVEACFDPV